jgi:phosphatidylethanolamine/phosphatidyl-N-methylethanolamine N-methyltransferase
MSQTPNILNQKVARFYNRIQAFYPLIDSRLRKDKKCLLHKINQLPPGALLEIGCGGAQHWSNATPHTITGIDISEKMLSRVPKHSKVNLLLMDGEEMHFEDCSFDYVLISHVISVTSRPEKMLAEAHRVLKQGGKLFLQNHFSSGKKHSSVDYFLQPFASLFCFRLYFPLQELSALSQFTPLEEHTIRNFPHHKLMVFGK